MSCGGPYRSLMSARHSGPDRPHPQFQLSASRTSGPRRRSRAPRPRSRSRGHHHASRARRGRGPPIGTTICVQPCVHLTESVAESFGRNADPDANWKPAFGVASGLLCRLHRATRQKPIRLVGAASRSRKSRPVISTLPSLVSSRDRTFRSAMTRPNHCQWSPTAR